MVALKNEFLKDNLIRLSKMLNMTDDQGDESYETDCFTKENTYDGIDSTFLIAWKQ